MQVTDTISPVAHLPLAEAEHALPGRLRHWDERADPADVTLAGQRLMAVHAHPDDEASKGSGSVAHYSRLGVRSTLVCCTGGEAGDILNEKMQHPDVLANLDRVRMFELADSVDHLGFDTAYLLGYRDSGMPDSDHNAHVDAFGNTGDEALARLVAVIRAERPQVLLAYDEHEAYPHPDHVRAHELCMAAWDAAADPDWTFDGVELGEPWEIRKLYWFHWSFGRMQAMHEEFLRLGWESPFTDWLDNRSDKDDRVTTRVDVGDYMDERRRSLLAHRTQIDPDSFWLRIPDERVRDLWPWEDYVLVHDRSPDPRRDVEVDLFERIG